MSRSADAVRFSSATTLPTNRCLQSCRTSMVSPSPLAGVPRAWRGISIRLTMSGNFSRICSTTKGMQCCHNPGRKFFNLAGFRTQFRSCIATHLARNFLFGEFARVPCVAARIWFQFVESLARNHIDEWLLIREWINGRGPCESRRRLEPGRARKTQRTHDGWPCRGFVARGREIRSDLGWLQRPGSRREPEGTVRRDRGAGRGRAGNARSAGGALWRLLRRLCEFGAMAGIAFPPRSDPRLPGGLRQLSRSERLHGACAAAFQEARHRLLDSGLSFPRARRRTARSRRHATDRAVPAYAVADAFRHRRRAASSRPDRGNAGL